GLSGASDLPAAIPRRISPRACAAPRCLRQRRPSAASRGGACRRAADRCVDLALSLVSPTADRELAEGVRLPAREGEAGRRSRLPDVLGCTGDHVLRTAFPWPRAVAVRAT